LETLQKGQAVFYNWDWWLMCIGVTGSGSTKLSSSLSQLLPPSYSPESSSRSFFPLALGRLLSAVDSPSSFFLRPPPPPLRLPPPLGLATAAGIDGAPDPPPGITPPDLPIRAPPLSRSIATLLSSTSPPSRFPTQAASAEQRTPVPPTLPRPPEWLPPA